MPRLNLADQVSGEALATLWTELSVLTTDRDRGKLIDLEFSVLMLLLATQSILRQIDHKRPPSDE